MNALMPLLFGAWLVVTAGSTIAQPVYRCDAGGKVVYSHDPCPGAREVDTTPTQGLDKSSGQSRKGKDVRDSEFNKAMADAMRPLLNETPEERQRRHRRAKLGAAASAECYALDPKLKAAKSETELFELRKRYRELGC